MNNKFSRLILGVRQSKMPFGHSRPEKSIWCSCQEALYWMLGVDYSIIGAVKFTQNSQC
jgi:hypothetical protein